MRARRTILVAMGSLAALLGSAATTYAASPSPGAGGDPRSSGQGPGLVGDPAFAVVAVIAIGVIAVVGTLAYIRLTGGRRTG